MTLQPAETITGQKAMDLLRYIIDSRQFCKIKISGTFYGWITLLSDIRQEGTSTYLLIDGIAGFKPALSLSKNGEVLLEYSERSGVHGYFTTRVIKCYRQVIWVECPEVIYRVQRRSFFRLKAQGGTEIVFQVSKDQEEKAKVRDYSLGGVAFLASSPLPLKTGDQLKNVDLRIPREIGWVVIHISLAVVRRVETPPHPGLFVYALEFLQMTDATKRLFTRHIFERQRLLLRKLGKNLPLANPF